MPYEGRVAITPRPTVALRKAMKEAVAENETTMNDAIIHFMQWYVGDRTDLPKRLNLS